MTQATIGESVEERLAALKALALFAEVPLQVKEFVSDWVLLTYDIPKSDEGDRTRQKFLQWAGLVGAVQHTESVYLLPWTGESNLEVVELAKVGKVYAWYARNGDTAQAAQITRDYDRRMRRLVDKLKERTFKVLGLVQKRHRKRARRMLDKTLEHWASLSKAVALRGDPEMAQVMMAVREALNVAEGGI